MSITAAAVKKAAAILIPGKSARKAIGFAAAFLITLALLPVMLLLAMGHQLSNAENEAGYIDFSQFIQNLSPEQKERFSQMEDDGKAIEKEMEKLGIKDMTVKAQMIYLTYFDDVQKDENFFAEYCSLFKENDNEKLIEALNRKYGLSISYEEFMRSYSVIVNVSIDPYLFINLDIKNNIDLSVWAENAYKTQWGCVPHTDGSLLTDEKYKALKEKYPQDITADCDKWLSRRTVDNYNLLRSYLWYDHESRTISEDNYSISDMTVQELFDSATVKGSIDTIPETKGTAVLKENMIGIYVGNGNVIYAKSVKDGIVIENISIGGWTSWFEIPWIQYGDEKSFSNEIKFEEYDEKKKNNLGLVQWAIQAHENGWGYVYGTYGNVLTERGVTRTKLAGREWTHWLQIPYISYVQKEEDTTENKGEK